MTFCAETGKRNIIWNPLDYGRAEEAHLDPCESFVLAPSLPSSVCCLHCRPRCAVFIAVLGVLSSLPSSMCCLHCRPRCAAFIAVLGVLPEFPSSMCYFHCRPRCAVFIAVLGVMSSLPSSVCCLHCRPRCAVFIAVLDVLSSDIDKRAKAYSEVSDLFGLLCNLIEMEAM